MLLRGSAEQTYLASEALLKRASVRFLFVLGPSMGVAAAAVAACSSDPGTTICSAQSRCSHEAGSHDDATVANDAEAGPADEAASDDAGQAVDAPLLPIDAMPPQGTFCTEPGSVVWTDQGPGVVPGGSPSLPDLSWMRLPSGFCAHYFGTVPYARQLRFAPGGELFVASPRTGTTGGNPQGALGGIAVLPDDDHDGVADTNLVFLENLPSIQGLLFANGAFYYQDAATIRSVAYHPGDRTPSSSPSVVTTITAPQAAGHWPKVLDIAMDGTIYITNGGSQGDACLSTNPTLGAIFALQKDGSTSLVARGFRNPIALRCESNHNVCLAAELALDYSAQQGGREKLVPVRRGDDWGYPCCASHNLPYTGVQYSDKGGTPDCSGVAADTDSFAIAHTPFGLDFETGAWPAPWTRRVFVTLHGEFGSWAGARVVAIGIDPSTGMPNPATELGDGGPQADSMLEFATGWAVSTMNHGRPAPIAFSADGRMFLGNDNDGIIVWIAPVTLMQK